MWAHYTEGHRGFCLGYDTRYPPFNDSQKIYRIKYSASIPIVNPVQILSSEGLDSFGPLMAMITTKSSHWAYEKEWRIFHLDGDLSFSLLPNTITAVYLGCLMIQEHKDHIATIIKDSSIKIFEMHKEENKYELHTGREWKN